MQLTLLFDTLALVFCLRQVTLARDGYPTTMLANGTKFGATSEGRWKGLIFTVSCVMILKTVYAKQSN